MFERDREPDIFYACDLYVKGRILKAQEALEEYYAINPDSTSALNLLGHLYLISGDHESAVSSYKKLISKFISGEEYDRALTAAGELLKTDPDNEEYIRIIADLYEKKGCPGLRNRCLLAMADAERHKGKFEKCAEIYSELADTNAENQSLIIKILHSLGLVNSFKTMSEILIREEKAQKLQYHEIDKVIRNMISGGCPAEHLETLIAGYIARNPEEFKKAERIILGIFRRGFKKDLLKVITDKVPIKETEHFLSELKDIANDSSVTMQRLKLASFKHNNNLIKGLIFELFVENALNINEISSISMQYGTEKPLEEALKMAAETQSKEEMLSNFEKLKTFYISGNPAKADAVDSYLNAGIVPNDLSEFFMYYKPYEKPETEEEPAAQVAVEEHKSAEEPVHEPVAIDSFFGADDNDSAEIQKVDLSDDFGAVEDVPDAAVSASLDGLETFMSASEEPKTQAFAGFDDGRYDGTDDSGHVADFFDTPAETEEPEIENSDKNDDEKLIFVKSEPQNTQKNEEDDFFSKEVDG